MGPKVSLFSLISIVLRLLPEAISSYWTLLTISSEFRKLKKISSKFDFVYPGLPSLKKCIVTIHDLNKTSEIIKMRLFGENQGQLN